MSNICEFDMNVTGKRKDIRKLLEWMDAQYCYYMEDGEHRVECSSDRHFCGISNIYFDLYDGDEDEEMTQYAEGDCRWSVRSCMMEDDPMSYPACLRNEGRGYMSRAIGIIEATRALGLKVEIYSREPGMCFSEHYVVDHGQVEISEETDYVEHWIDCYGSREEAEREEGIAIGEEQWNQREEEPCVIECAWHPFLR